MHFIQVLCYTKKDTGQREKIPPPPPPPFIFCVSVKVSVKHGPLFKSMTVTFNFQLSINNCVIRLLDHTHTICY